VGAFQRAELQLKSLLNYPHLGIFIVAWFIADLAVPTFIAMAHRFGLLDRPGAHGGKNQAAPIPYLGGLGIFLAFSLALFSTLRFESLQAFVPFLVLISGAAVVTTLGLLDDRKPISAVVKLGVLTLITIVLAAFGVRMELLPDYLGGSLNLALTLLWIVGVISATNSLDNTDGVVGGVTAIAGVFIFAIAWGASAADSQSWLSYLAVALIGSSLGFLRYNFPPARVYLGDNGAFLLGYLLATILVFAEYSSDPLQAILIPCLILVVPLADIVISTLLRIRDGDVKNWKEAVLYCGKDHLAHLLMASGLTKRQAVCSLYALGIAGGSTALLIQRLDSRAFALSAIVIFAAGLVAFGIFLGRARQKSSSEEAIDRPKESSPIPVATENDPLVSVPILNLGPEHEFFESPIEHAEQSSEVAEEEPSY